MANPRLFLTDFIDCQMSLTHMTSEFASLSFEYENKTYCSELSINMNAPLIGKPLMAGILERDPILLRYFYLGKLCEKIELLKLEDDGSIIISNQNKLKHEFVLTIPGKNSKVEIPWRITQEEKHHYRDEKSTRSVFFSMRQ